jgi:hypothetical protein
MSVTEAAKKNKVSEQTIYVWQRHFVGPAPTHVKGFKALKTENTTFKRLLADRDSEVEIMRRGGSKKWRSHLAQPEEIRFVRERDLWGSFRGAGHVSVTPTIARFSPDVGSTLLARLDMNGPRRLAALRGPDH